jgi:LysM repeat protein
MRLRGSSQTARRRLAGAVGVLAAGILGLAGCGTTDEASRQTLPPLITTTTSTTTTTTILVERFYTVQPGDILTVIAAERGVTVQAIVEKNDLKSQDDIFAGQVLEIPV